MKSKITHILSSLGLDLNPKEIKIYLALLEVGTAAASTLGQRTHIHRSTAQYTCQQLVETGLARVIEKNNTFLYSAEPPERLLSLLDQQKEKIDQKQNQVEQILGDLKGLMNPHANIPKIQFFTGVDGIIELFEDILRTAPTILGALQINDDIHPDILHYIQTRYAPTRSKLGNEAWMLFNDNDKTRQYQEQDECMRRVSLLLPEKKFPFASCMHIYDGKVAFYSYQKNDLTGVLIENPLIYETQKSIFQLAWDQARSMPQNKQHKDKSLPD